MLQIQKITTKVAKIVIKVAKMIINFAYTIVVVYKFNRKLKDLCIEASNTGLGWPHYWINDKKEFRFAEVESEEVIAIYSNDLEKSLKEIIRYYLIVEEDDEGKKKTFITVEHWTDTEFKKYKFKDLDTQPFETLEITHELGRVHFISFANNSTNTSDLDKIKTLIDCYDRVTSSYANDIDDIQQIIYVLKGYNGTKLDGFLNDLKTFKVIKLNSGDGSDNGVQTLTVDIPVEARNSLLELLEKQIIKTGQGIMTDNSSFGNASGVALKFFYRNLEIKAGLLEAEFKDSIKELIEAILNYYHIPFNDIKQTWTRNMISNDIETAQIAQRSSGIIPKKLVLKNHLWEEDPNEAERIFEEEKKQNMNMFNSYPINPNIDGDDDDEE